MGFFACEETKVIDVEGIRSENFFVYKVVWENMMVFDSNGYCVHEKQCTKVMGPMEQWI